MPRDPADYRASEGDERHVYRAGPLILHELVPGHHFQLNLTAENHSLPPFRRYAPFPVYSEGWADYSSQLGTEMGAYHDDYDRYAPLAQNVHQSVRLVVDTGLNYMGWSLEQAKRLVSGRRTLRRSGAFKFSTRWSSSSIP
jgi:uncharacterized protein (DUF885 family)